MLKPVDLSRGKSVLRSVLNIFVSQSTEKTSSAGYVFCLVLRKLLDEKFCLHLPLLK